MSSAAASQSAAPTMLKKSWTREEDTKMLDLIKEHGTTGKWTLISSIMGSRSSKQCRERYNVHLRPDIRKGPFTEKEDDLVNRLQKEMGMQWSKICKFLPGRSDNAVKNRWYILNRHKTKGDDTSEPSNTPAKAAAPKVKEAKKSRSVEQMKSRPKVPVLNLAAVVPRAPEEPIKVDLLELYHSHAENLHEASASTRSENPASDSLAEEKEFPLSARMLQCSARFTDVDDDDMDSWMSELLYSQSDSEDDSLCSEEKVEEMMLRASISDAAFVSSAGGVSVPTLNFESINAAAQGPAAPDSLAIDEFTSPGLFDFGSLEENNSPNLPADIFGHATGAVKRSIQRFTPRLTPRSPGMFLLKKQQRGSLSARALVDSPRS